MQATRNCFERCLQASKAHLTWYGKHEARKGRKMGHVTFTADNMAELRAQVAKAGLPSSMDLGAQVPPAVGIIMGSDSDLPVMKAAAEIMEEFGVPYELTIVSAHRTPDRMVQYARSAVRRGLHCIIAGAGGAAHLPGMVAAMTPLPVIGVPVKTSALGGVDSLHSIVQMPRGVPVATVAIGNAANAGLLAVRILGSGAMPHLVTKMSDYLATAEKQVLKKAAVLEAEGWQGYLDRTGLKNATVM